MRTYTQSWIMALAMGLLPVDRARAHEEMLARPLSSETISAYEALPPIGKIFVRHDTTDTKNPKLSLQCDLFKAEIPTEALRNLPQAKWDEMVVPFSLSSFDNETGRWVERPYLQLAVPLTPLANKPGTGGSLCFSFDDQGRFSGRWIKQFVPTKDGQPRIDLSPVEADGITMLYEAWPIDSTETVEQILKRAWQDRFPSTQAAK